MVKPRWFLSALMLAIVAMTLLPAMNADPVKKATEVTFAQPVEIPGMVLIPGTYVIKVPDPVSHADMVGFFNADESYLYKLVRTIPAYRLDPADKTILTFEERPGDSPRAVKTWYYPGDLWGREFVYGKVELLPTAEAPALAELAAPEPAFAPEETAPAVEEEVAEVAAEAPAPVEIAAAAPAPEAIPVPPPEELPKTGTELPLLALAGACSLGLGVLLKSRG